jgi:hypothetical protein
MFLEREIKTRKQMFGVEIYDLMEMLETDTSLDASEKETKIRAIFDATRKDIAVIRAKKDCKTEEMAVLDAESGAADTTMPPSAPPMPPSSGTVLTNTHPSGY